MLNDALIAVEQTLVGFGTTATLNCGGGAIQAHIPPNSFPLLY